MKLIAEVGGNHEGDQLLAVEYAKVAISSGAKYIKYQLYKPDLLVNSTVDPDRHGHFGRFELSFDAFVKIAEHCEEAGVEVIASCWDSQSLSMVDPYVVRHKVGSGDFENKVLIREILRLGKPVILSCGLAGLDRIVEVIAWVVSEFPHYNNKEMLTLMHCTSVYPCPDEEVNLSAIQLYRDLFPNIDIGFSDHSVGNDALRIANILGVEWVEKHFSIDRSSSEFRDHKCSIEPHELAELVETFDKDNTLLSRNACLVKPTKSEVDLDHVVSFKRACYFVRDMKAGDLISIDDVVTLRPCVGVSSWDIDSLVGSRIMKDVSAYQPISRECIGWKI